MKSLKIFLTLLAVSASMIGCTKNFGEINTDPNAPTSVSADQLLTPILRETVLGSFNYGNGAALARYLARTNYNTIEAYEWGVGSWSRQYLMLSNIHEMIKIAERDHKTSAKAVAYILKAFTGSTLTDSWGDVPYFEAGSGNITPGYDLQKDIYTAEGGIIGLLKEAEELLSDPAVDPMVSDIMYGGNLMKWRRLGNSLRLRYLMRISNRASEITTFNLAGEIAEAVKLPLLATNSDNALLAFLPAAPNQCPVYGIREGEFDYIRMSKESDEWLNPINDPRRIVWFMPASKSVERGTPEYKGIPCGLSSTTLENMGILQNIGEVSQMGARYRATPDGCDAVLMNCSEVMFLVAEAIVKGYAEGNAGEWYDRGITASLEYYCKDLSSDGFNAYMAQPGVVFDEDNAMKLIMFQKWTAQFFVGSEAWLDFKRTGLPEMEPLMENRNPTKPGEIPSRFLYPEDEQTLNVDNFSAAVVRQEGGNDDINTKLWWEK
ncbi:MAG: SusD/RagB family nutrient-binding outer membrane lipoprotein [Bacteroidales bacterium]|jgi:hypothetical protein|nr:SusD/RagB family nutrient-binding outer membrane lipoprotein [Bacteroidales bacterium]